MGSSKDNLEIVLEKVPPLTSEEYARTFEHMSNNSSQYEDMSRMARKLIVANGFDKGPIRLLR